MTPLILVLLATTTLIHAQSTSSDGSTDVNGVTLAFSSDGLNGCTSSITVQRTEAFVDLPTCVSWIVQDANCEDSWFAKDWSANTCVCYEKSSYKGYCYSSSATYEILTITPSISASTPDGSNSGVSWASASFYECSSMITVQRTETFVDAASCVQWITADAQCEDSFFTRDWIMNTCSCYTIGASYHYCYMTGPTNEVIRMTHEDLSSGYLHDATKCRNIAADIPNNIVAGYPDLFDADCCGLGEDTWCADGWLKWPTSSGTCGISYECISPTASLSHTSQCGSRFNSTATDCCAPTDEAVCYQGFALYPLVIGVLGEDGCAADEKPFLCRSNAPDDTQCNSLTGSDCCAANGERMACKSSGEEGQFIVPRRTGSSCEGDTNGGFTCYSISLFATKGDADMCGSITKPLHETCDLTGIEDPFCYGGFVPVSMDGRKTLICIVPHVTHTDDFDDMTYAGDDTKCSAQATNASPFPCCAPAPQVPLCSDNYYARRMPEPCWTIIDGVKTLDKWGKYTCYPPASHVSENGHYYHLAGNDQCVFKFPYPKDNVLQCFDGTTCNGETDGWECCNAHGLRIRCPANKPKMCSVENKCSNGQDYCCEEDCTFHGGDRLCPNTETIRSIIIWIVVGVVLGVCCIVVLCAHFCCGCCVGCCVKKQAQAKPIAAMVGTQGSGKVEASVVQI